jgi:hypothetical protein
MKVHICPLSGPRKVDAPRRPPISLATTTASRKSPAPAPSCSATASAANTAEWQVCPIQTMSSKSWAIEPALLARAASTGAQRSPVATTVARPAPAEVAASAAWTGATRRARAAAWTAATMSRTW